MFFLQRRPPVSCRPILPWTLPGTGPTNFPGSAPSLRAYARHRRFHHCCRSSRAGRRYLRALAKANGSRRKQRATRQEYPRHGPQAIPGRGVELLALQLGLWYLLFRPPVSAKDFYAFFKGCGGTEQCMVVLVVLLLDTLQDVPRRMPRRNVVNIPLALLLAAAGTLLLWCRGRAIFPIPAYRRRLVDKNRTSLEGRNPDGCCHRFPRATVCRFRYLGGGRVGG